MISVKNLVKKFNAGTPQETTALSGITLEIAEGQRIIIAGPNGSGKSTLLNIIAGSLIPDEGNILIKGEDITTDPDYKRSRFTGRIFQDPFRGTAPALSILDNFRLALLRTRSKKLTSWQNRSFRDQVFSIVQSLGLGLEDKLSTPVGNLSGGQRQALTLLMAVMDNTSVLLMDEPVSALDPRMADFIMKKAEEIILVNNLTTILVSHRLSDIKNFGNRLIMMQEGKIIKDIPAEERNQMPEESFLKFF